MGVPDCDRPTDEEPLAVSIADWDLPARKEVKSLGEHDAIFKAAY
jgi:hypothetical protein